MRVAAAVLVGLALAGNAFAVEFEFTPEVGMDQSAIDGFEAAGAMWSAIYDDDVTVNIDIGFRGLAPNVLAETGSERIAGSYEALLDALADDRTSADDTAAFAGLHAAPAFSALLNRTANNPGGSGSAEFFLDDDDDANNRSVRLTRANAKALGLLPGDHSARDASITFSDEFNWDFDASDGIAANHFDFVRVAAHEIGHMLGFTSGVDILDNNSPPLRGPFNDHEFVFVNSKDLFRFSTDSVAEGAGVIDWTADARDKFFSIDAGTTDLGGFSTGKIFGDGQQASHWKDDRGLGIMDPTVATGESPPVTALDTRLFDVIGWDRTDAIARGAADLSISLEGNTSVTYVIRVSNGGPDAVTSAVVDHPFPANVIAVSWQCVPSPGAACSATGSGAIHDSVDLPVGASVTYTATGAATAPAGVSATVTPPPNVDDPDSANNTGAL